MNHCRCVVAGVLAAKRRRRNDGSAQAILGQVVGAPYAFIDHLVERHAGIPLHIHAHLAEHGHDAGILTNRAVAFGTHARIHQNLLDGIFGRRTGFLFVSRCHRLDEVRRVIIGNVLQCVGNALNDIFLFDNARLGGGQGGLVQGDENKARNLPAGCPDRKAGQVINMMLELLCPAFDG